jgi:hypothetical protein
MLEARAEFDMLPYGIYLLTGDAWLWSIDAGLATAQGKP